jgi:hypothetical protein
VPSVTIKEMTHCLSKMVMWCLKLSTMMSVMLMLPIMKLVVGQEDRGGCTPKTWRFVERTDEE